MATIKGKTFSGQHIELAGNLYDQCTFTACTFVFSGSGPIEIMNSSISADCTFDFVGPAAHTLIALQGIWSMGEWGRAQVRGTFNTIMPEFGLRPT